MPGDARAKLRDVEGDHSVRGDRAILRLAYMTGASTSFVVPFLLTFSFMFNYFFNTGAFYLDAGWFADLMWRKEWWLPNPTVGQIAPNFPPKSFYGIHFSPLLALISQVSRLLPFDQIDVFATYMATAHGLLGLFFYVVLQRRHRPPSLISSTVTTLLSVAFALSGLALSVTSYPHVEILIPALVLITIYLLLEQRLLAASIVGVLALSIREDVGLHFLAICGLLIALNRIRGVSLSTQMPLMVFAGAALLYSCGAIALQKYFFPSQDTFGWVYAGDPPFGHLTASFAWTRLTRFIELRPYVWLPLLLICLSAAALRNPYVALGALAVVPWLLLHISALSDGAGTLDIHYVFPIIIAVGWTAIALLRPASPTAHPVNYPLRLGLITGIVLSTFAGSPVAWSFFRATVPTEFALHPQKTRQFVDALREILPAIRQLRADTGTISLRPDMFAPTAWLVPQDWTADRQPSPDVDVLVFFNRGFEQDKALVQLGAMANPRVHSISGTNLLVAIASHVELGAPIMRLLEAAPDSVRSIPYFFAGFYGQEAGLRWAKTRSPSLSVRNCGARKVRVDVIGYAIWPHVAADSQRPDTLQVRVLINEARFSTLAFTPALRQVRLDIPITCVDGTMTIRFDYDHLIAPSRYTDSADTRPLGIGIVGDPQFE